MDITCLHGGSEEIGDLTRSWVDLKESEGKRVWISALI